MTLVEWKNEFSIGIAEVDFEHREMIDLINDSFHEAKKENSSTAVTVFLGEIYEKIAAHFALEEKVMKSLKYDQFEEHKEDHERLLDSILDIMDDYEDTAEIDEESFGAHLKEWFVGHFSTYDARMHRVLQH